MALVCIWLFVGHFVVKATIGNYVLGCVSLCVLCALYALYAWYVCLTYNGCVRCLNGFL